MKLFNHKNTIQIICPHCGRAHWDSWVITAGNEGGTADCISCGNPFDWNVNHRITYSTFARNAEVPK